MSGTYAQPIKPVSEFTPVRSQNNSFSFLQIISRRAMAPMQLARERRYQTRYRFTGFLVGGRRTANIAGKATSTAL